MNKYFFYAEGDKVAEAYARKVVNEAFASENRSSEANFKTQPSSWHGRKGLMSIEFSGNFARVERRINYRLNNNPKPFIFGFNHYRP